MQKQAENTGFIYSVRSLSPKAVKKIRYLNSDERSRTEDIKMAER